MSLWGDIKERLAVNKLLGLSRDLVKLSSGKSEEGFLSKLGNSMKNAMKKFKGWVSRKSANTSDLAETKQVNGLVAAASGLVSESKKFRGEVRARRAALNKEGKAAERQQRENARATASTKREADKKARKRGSAPAAPSNKLDVRAARLRDTAGKLEAISEREGISAKDAKTLQTNAGALGAMAGELRKLSKVVKSYREARVKSDQMRQALKKAQANRGAGAKAVAGKMRGQEQGKGGRQ